MPIIMDAPVRLLRNGARHGARMVCLWLVLGGAVAGAQPVAPATATATRVQTQAGELDDALRSRLLTASDPRSNWMAGQLDRGDIESQVRHFAAARVSDPGNRLYLATLALACLEPVQPRPAECDATDRLADWATRDEDNGLPSLLLAQRAHQHGNELAMLGHLENAAAQPRFDDYWGAGSLVIWEIVGALPAPDDATRLELAARLDAARVQTWPARARALCLSRSETADAGVREACARVGALMLKRGTTWSARGLGARIAAFGAATPAAKALAEADGVGLRAAMAACSEAIGKAVAGSGSPDAAVRAKSVVDYTAWVQREAKVGEPEACNELATRQKQN